MWLELALWFICGLILAWALLDPIGRVLSAAWQILLPILDSRPVDLRSEFGDWAGKYPP
jgi:hypothetical protein